MKLSVVIPVYNEQEVINKFYDKLKEITLNISYELIFIDDGSTDNTLEILKNIYKEDKKNIKIISFSRNFGKEAAMYAGLKSSRGKYTVIIDADLQQNPKYILEMIKFLDENNDYCSICMIQKKARVFKNIFYKLMNKITNIDIINGASDFRMFRRNVVESILLLSEKDRFSKGIFSWVGFKTYYQEYEVQERKGGKSKWPFIKLMRYAIDGIINFSSVPLRIPAYLGFISTILSFIYFIIILILMLSGININFNISLISFIIIFTSGIELISISIIGEYLFKVFNETKNRPIFIAKEKIGFDENLL